MNEKKKSTKILACLLSAFLGLLCPVSIVALADDVTPSDALQTVQDIYTDTRYYWDDLTSIDNMQDMLRAISTGTVPVEMLQTYLQRMYGSAAETATATNQALIAYANASTTGQSPTATIKDSYTITCKRKIVYPYNDMWETDYLYIYRDKNQDVYSPQQFGSYAVVPNSCLLVRDTSFDGVQAYSIPMSTNGIYIQTQFNDGIHIGFSHPNNTFVYESAEGTQTIGARTTFENVIKNNSYNTIQCNNLVDYYNQQGKGQYGIYCTWGEPLDVFECFAGLGYNYEYNGFMSYNVGFPNWYISTGYFNTQYDIPYIVNNTNNNNTTIINPAFPPVYMVPSDNPWRSGKTIDNTTINDYSDYGLTIDGLQFDFDLNALGAALGAEITPVITGLIDGTFSLQPDLGLQFGVAPADVNFIDLFNDWLDSITVYPPATRPQVPIITTYTSQQFDLNVFSTTVTYPLEVHQGANILWSTGQSVIEAVGIPLAVIFGLALFGIGVWFIF